MPVSDEPETKQPKPSSEKNGAHPSAPISRNADRHLLEQLVCPITRGSLRYDSKLQELISKRAGLAYPIRQGVPLMTETAARPLTEAELAALKATRPAKL